MSVAYSPPVRARRADRFPFAVIALVVALGVTGCGGDNDDQGGGDRATQGQRAEQNHAARAAQRLETYLRRNAKDLTGSHGKPGQVINTVHTTGGELKVFTLLNAEIATDDDPAREVCRLVRASGIPEAEGAVVVDAGDALIRRC